MSSFLGCSLDAAVMLVLVCIGSCCLNWCYCLDLSLTGLCYCLNLHLIVTVFSVCPSCVLRFQHNDAPTFSRSLYLSVVAPLAALYVVEATACWSRRLVRTGGSLLMLP